MAFTTISDGADPMRGKFVGRKVVTATMLNGQTTITKDIELDCVVYRLRTLVAADGAITYVTTLENEDDVDYFAMTSTTTGTERLQYPSQDTDAFIPIVLSGVTTVLFTANSGVTANRTCQLEIIYRV